MGDDKIPPLLIVEDDPALQKQIRWSISGYEAVAAADREEALELLRRRRPAVATVDLGLPPDPDSVSEGLLLVQQAIEFDPMIKVIVVTGQDDRGNALRAVALGAYDFLTKPFEPEVLQLVIDRAFHVHGLQAENRRLLESSHNEALGGIITGDPAMLKLCRTVDKVADSTATVLFLGESGTGKELLARGIHDQSPRRKERFVAINCAAIPENLLESELFGYERGAFTGANKTTPGRIESAHRGTLMLDEIGDLPLPLQAKLLRFLQERVVERLGGREEIPVDVRIVCATHRDLKAQIAEGAFREDLYYRLAEIVLPIPPLRDRVGDPALLAHAMVRRFAEENRRGSIRLSNAALEAIDKHSWPGNVRELENCMKRAVIMAEGKLIEAADIGLAGPEATEDEALDLRTIRDAAERSAVIRALARANGNIVKATSLLGISRPTFYDLMHKFGLK